MSGRPFCVLLLALACSGCNQVLGLDPPVARDDTVDAADDDDAAPDEDGAVSDASSADAATSDGPMPTDARVIDARPIDARTDACVTIIDGNECTYDLPCSNPPVPRDTLCNDGADQCDGNGNCVDCTNSGGCGECCTCSLNHVCVPS